MPFAASERHEIWSANVRHLDMVDEFLVGGKAYAVTVRDKFPRAARPPPPPPPPGPLLLHLGPL